MPKQVKEFLLDQATGKITTEYDDNSVDTYELAKIAQITDDINAEFAALGDQRQKKIAAAMADSSPRRHKDQSWLSPEAHAVSTGFINGTVVENAGNAYVCIAPGTTGAASPPTGAGMALIVDGTVKWQYIGPTWTALAGAPTLAVSASAPALPRFYRNALCNFASGAAVVRSNDGWFKVVGGATVLNINGIGEFGAGWAGISFCSESKTITFARAGAAGYGIRITVNGRHVRPGMVKDLSTATMYYTLTFSTSEARRIDLCWDQATFCCLKGVYVEATASVWAPTDAKLAVKIGAVGDSYTASGGGYGAADQDVGVVRTTFGLMGFDNVFVDAYGGSGLVAGGGNKYAAASRIAKMAAFGPDIVYVSGTGNDDGQMQEVLTAAVAEYVSAIRAVLPSAVLIFSGQSWPGNTTGAEMVVESRLRTAVAVAAALDSKIFFQPESGDPSGAFLQGTGRINAPSGTGNNDAFMADDGLHPVQRGLEYLAMRKAHALRPILATIA